MPKKKKLPKAIRYDPQRDGVTQGLLATYVDCRQRASYKVDGWQPTRVSKARLFGTIIHAVLHYIYNFAAKSTKRLTHEKIETVGKLFLDSYCAKMVKMHQGSADTVELIELLHNMAYSLIRPYIDHYPEDFSKRKVRWLELEGVFKVKHEGLWLRGRRDGIKELVRRKRRELWLLETKTSSQISENSLEASLTFNFQNLFYMLASEITLGKPLVGVDYNIIRTPSLRQGASEEYPDFCQRIYDDIRKRPDHYFHRYEIVYPVSTQKVFAGELRAKIKEFLLWRLHGGNGDIRTFKNELSCIKRWTCEYLDMCSTGLTNGYYQSDTPFPELED